MRVFQAWNEIIMWEDDYAVVNGFVHIADLKDWTKKHFFQVTPSLMKKMTVYSEEAIPLRPKASHFIHAPSIFESLFNMIKPMMSEKQLNRVSIIKQISSTLMTHLSITDGSLCLKFR